MANGHKTVPIAYIKGKFMGGCDDVKALQTKGILQDELQGLPQRPKVVNAYNMDSIKLVRPPRGKALHPLFWFPNVANNWVVRLTGLLVTALTALSIAFYEHRTGKWIAAFLLLDFTIRLFVGSSMSPLGMIGSLLASPFKPQFKPGPPKQFAASCGTMFTLIATCCFFTGHNIPAACVMGGLLGAAALEGFFDFCLGCVFYGLGIRFGLIPPHVYRIYTNIREETVSGWDYENLPSGAPRPERVDTDASSEVSLKYKTRSDEWTKDDFHLIRNMQVSYFAMPLSLAGLAVAFKLASGVMAFSVARMEVRPHETYYHTLTIIAAAVFVIFFNLYVLRLVLYSRKCSTEWDCPLRSPSFGAISLFLMLFAFLIFDVNNRGRTGLSDMLFDGDEGLPTAQDPTADNGRGDDHHWEWFARVLFWLGAVTQMLLSVAKFGEWVGKRLELEHVHPTWMMLPVGCLVAALVAPIVPALNSYYDDDDMGGPTAQAAALAAAQQAGDLSGVFDSRAFANYELARFFYAFGYAMWVVLFGVTFFKVVTTHNSDDRQRHSVWIWVAAPALVSIVSFNMCFARGAVFGGMDLLATGVCTDTLSLYFFLALVIFLGLAWATLPYINFFGRDKYGMGYWIECFAADTLAAAAAVYYSVYGTYTGEVLMVMLLVVASVFNFVCMMWFLSQLVRGRTVFCPEIKWGPLSFMKLTHEAVRGALPTFTKALTEMRLEDEGSVQLFCAHFSQFVMLHEEHSRHEDEVIFKAFNDLFPEQGKKWNDDHEHDRVLIVHWKGLVNTILNTQAPPQARAAAIQELQTTLPQFLEHFAEHLKGEEDHLQPVGKRYLPLELQKQISRKVWEITPAARWEVLVPYLVNNLPRNLQRVRYLKALLWAMPERAQQIGAIVYRNVDSVKWEMLRTEIPEMIPRGTYNWRRYY